MKKGLYIFLIIIALLLSGCGVFDFEKETAENELGLMSVEDMKGGSDRKAKKLKNEILSASDNLKKASGENLVYYIAQDGSEWNDGLSPEEPTTVDQVNSLYLTKGDLVLFKRGDTFRLEEQIKPVRGISYGAYGEGEKPVLMGSVKNYADKSLWESQDNNLWQIHLGTDDAAQIIFNNGELIGFRKHTFEEVTANGDFYYDLQNKILYLYLNNVNPGEYFDSIEIATTKCAFGTFGTSLSPLNNIKFENLCIKYFTVFAFNVSFADGIDVTDCEMGWIGGAITSSQRDRYGNAVQFWNSAKNINVSNNYIYQVFDAAITFQGTSGNDYTNLTFKNNLIEYCSMNFEFWAQDNSDSNASSSDPDATMNDISFEDNILRFGGYGWGGLQRKIKDNQAFVLCWYKRYDDKQIKNFTVSNNIFDTANCNFFYGPNAIPRIDISGNIYYQKSGSQYSVIRDEDYNCDNQKTFETAIKTVDKNPTKIKWIN